MFGVELICLVQIIGFHFPTMESELVDELFAQDIIAIIANKTSIFFMTLIYCLL